MSHLSVALLLFGILVVIGSTLTLYNERRKDRAKHKCISAKGKFMRHRWDSPDPLGLDGGTPTERCKRCPATRSARKSQYRPEPTEEVHAV